MIVPGFTPLVAKTGKMTAVFRNGEKQLYLHSRYDPEAEAARFATGFDLQEGDSVIVYGTGLGYHVREVLKRVGPAGKVFVFQLGIGLFEVFTQLADWPDLWSDPRISLVVKDSLPDLARILAGVMDSLEPEKIKLIIHRPSLELLPPGTDDFKWALEEWTIKYSTQKRFSPLMQDNLDHNLEFCRQIVRVSRLFGRFKGIPAVLVSAGPSLDGAVEGLKRFVAERRGIVAAVGTALKTMAVHKIRPHLALITDPQEVVIHQVADLPAGIPLIIFPTVHPDVIKSHKGPKILACPDDGLTVEKLGMGEAEVETGGSVATTLLDIGIKLGANPIIFAGQDLGYPEGKMHADNTMYDRFHANLRTESRYLRRVRANNGGEVYTSKILDLYRRWMEDRIQRERGIRFINTSESGAFVEGTEVQPFHLMAKDLPDCGIDVEEIIREALDKGETNL